MSIESLNEEKQAVIRIMQSLGWTATRTGTGKAVRWEFRRMDDDGLYDVVSVKQGDMRMNWLIWRGGNEPDLRDVMHRAAVDWLVNNFPRHAGIIREVTL